METKTVVYIYLMVLVIIAVLYALTAGISTFAQAPTAALEAAIPVFVDLLKVVTGAVIGSLSTALGKKE
ncbi:hypothetical protein [Methylocystis sp. S23]